VRGGGGGVVRGGGGVVRGGGGVRSVVVVNRGYYGYPFGYYFADPFWYGYPWYGYYGFGYQYPIGGYPYPPYPYGGYRYAQPDSAVLLIPPPWALPASSTH
jgi:hypothetical protein